jgi:crotonobetainyl-CoA:carnitine CoA-transferase CaiB-like acyl-CoA transferase
MHGLRDLRVIDFTSGIAGPYCTKLLADAGAEVIKIESEAGDPLRRWTASNSTVPTDTDGPLFRFLNASKKSLIGTPDSPRVRELLLSSDLVVDDFRPSSSDPLPALIGPCGVRLSITPFGLSGPWSQRPATEFTLQAESGSIGSRGIPGHEPFQAGGRITEWLGGTFGAVAALAAVQRARATGHGEHIDFSLLEVMTYASSNYLDLTFRLLGVENPTGSIQSAETPSIEPTADGFVGFCTNTAQQFSDFLLLIERADLRDDRSLYKVGGRAARFDAWNEIVHDYTQRHTTDEIVRAASLLRLPVAPVNNGDTVRNHEQLVARGAFQPEPEGPSLHPVPPYRIDGQRPARPHRAPALDQHANSIAARRASSTRSYGPRQLPLAGIRVLDLTAWWAGPSATHMLGCLGAEVIHIESIQRIDGMRTTGGVLAGSVEQWWECSAFFLSTNANKRGLTLNLTEDRGVSILERLIQTADAVVENFTPRVLENFGMSWERIQATNPQTIFVRMPAFGLDGPWRNHTGFAQTMEQMTGLAWVTGHPDDQPRIQRGPCDPLAGMHGAFAFLVALAERRELGRGVHVEVAMVEGALNAAAEQLIEFTAHGHLMQREGNRSPHAAPQGLYACRGGAIGSECWLALSIEHDAQWFALREELGMPAWSDALETHGARRAAHDRIDAELRQWFADCDRDERVEQLVEAGIPAAVVRDPRTTSQHPQHVARGFYETLEHPIAGTHPIPTVPFRYASVDHWLHHSAPTLGQHNREILTELGLDEDEIRSLETEGIIGDRPAGK